MVDHSKIERFRSASQRFRKWSYRQSDGSCDPGGGKHERRTRSNGTGGEPKRRRGWRAETTARTAIRHRGAGRRTRRGDTGRRSGAARGAAGRDLWQRPAATELESVVNDCLEAAGAGPRDYWNEVARADGALALALVRGTLDPLRATELAETYGVALALEPNQMQRLTAVEHVRVLRRLLPEPDDSPGRTAEQLDAAAEGLDTLAELLQLAAAG